MATELSEQEEALWEQISQNQYTQNILYDVCKKVGVYDISRLYHVLDQLVEDSWFLEALNQAGVDNWSGYSYAWDIMREWENEDD